MRIAVRLKHSSQADFILRSALQGASRRMATCAASQAAILRDAPLRCGAPQDEAEVFRGTNISGHIGARHVLPYSCDAVLMNLCASVKNSQIWERNDVAKISPLRVGACVGRGRACMRCPAGRRPNLCRNAATATIPRTGPALDTQRRMADQRRRCEIHQVLAPRPDQRIELQ